ncbi:hypothetical protein GCM10022224_095070 [Nonomuraea antimicrobica]|uniref:PrgI family protein n=1 Tax=Nonomuraea antimicrobica TaxID=561173 RepID=A0ABP7E7F8_9ACTN
MRHASKERLVAKIPADVEMPDKLFANLTVRQVAILAGTAVLAAWVYLMAGDRLPVPVLVAIVLPVIACGCALALGRRDGLSLDRLAAHALTYLRRDHKLVMTEEGVSAPPTWCRVRGRLPGAFPSQTSQRSGAGVIQLVRASGTLTHRSRRRRQHRQRSAFAGKQVGGLVMDGSGIGAQGDSG